MEVFHLTWPIEDQLAQWRNTKNLMQNQPTSSYQTCSSGVAALVHSDNTHFSSFTALPSHDSLIAGWGETGKWDEHVQRKPNVCEDLTWYPKDSLISFIPPSTARRMSPHNLLSTAVLNTSKHVDLSIRVTQKYFFCSWSKNWTWSCYDIVSPPWASIWG